MLGSETGLKDQVSTVLIPETNINANDTKINGVKYEKKHFSSFSFLNNHSLFYIFFSVLSINLHF